MRALPRFPVPVDRHLGPVLMWIGAAVLTVLLTVNTLPPPLGTGGGYAHAGPAAVAGTVAVAAALLWRYPLAALAVLAAGAVAAAGVLAGQQFIPGVQPGDRLRVGFGEMIPVYVALCYVSATRSRRTALIALGLGVLVPAGYDVFALARGPGPHLAEYQAPVLYAAVFAWVVGQSIRKSRQLASASRAQAAERAMTAERLRLARELHDMVAHSVGIIAIQAGVGNRVIHTQPDAAQEALRVIETSSREALSGLRRTLVALRRADPAGPEPAGTPGLAEVDRLVAGAAEAGIEVSVRRTGTVRAMPAAVDLAAYRIVQESVTNVIRHSTARSCRIDLAYRPTELCVEVVDDGRPGAEPGRGTGTGHGFGIVGMRERAALLDGHLDAGPLPDRGFRVTAALPIPATTAEPAPTPNPEPA
ncbi:sensor histidine kinase [Actinocatenispora sera]|uniref:histidine kinase n=1 Tax=Actinocatenispora sera TaxID=390989 RepID=A0A810KX39_9ACTN|nr:sensor histidine kinase [Actinocatenispora sera]BCJ27654.1 two-component sensor histidine kinase [Actinocatenispora sera]